LLHVGYVRLLHVGYVRLLHAGYVRLLHAGYVKPIAPKYAMHPRITLNYAMRPLLMAIHLLFVVLNTRPVRERRLGGGRYAM